MAGSIQPFPSCSGDREHPVRTLQYLLRARNHPVTVDGIFGPKTDAAVRAFQDGEAPDRRRDRRTENVGGVDHHRQAGQPG